VRKNATRFSLLGMAAGLVAPTGLFLLGLLTDRMIDPLQLALVTMAGGVLALGTAGWLLGRKEDQLQTRNNQLQALSERLQALSATDPLTGVPNRRSLDERLAIEIARMTRYGSPLSLVMVDLDHFKALNDHHGHAAGDAVLRGVAEILDSEKRLGDMVARYGGEEFVAVLPHSDAAAALAWAERVRARLASTSFDLSGQHLAITASFGVASGRNDEDSSETLLRAADEALYEAKAAGRNQVALAPPRQPGHTTFEYGVVKG
jgi:diguanylate cyclase (GGDEF)-like protein